MKVFKIYVIKVRIIRFNYKIKKEDKSDLFHFFNGFISDKDERLWNIYEKSFPFETFQFSKGFISDKDEQY